MNIYLVRHGQTDYNVNNLLQGTSNIPLNSTGIEQAKKLKEKVNKLKLDFIYTSPLDRAITTANIINSDLKLPMYIDENLRERGFGVLEGIKGTDYDINLFWDYDKNYKYEDTECVRDFLKRIEEFFENLYYKYKDKNILIVTHNGVNIAASCYFEGMPKDKNLLGIKLENCDYKKYQKI